MYLFRKVDSCTLTILMTSSTDRLNSCNLAAIKSAENIRHYVVKFRVVGFWKIIPVRNDRNLNFAKKKKEKKSTPISILGMSTILNGKIGAIFKVFTS